jgi:hypothetical protein
MKNIKYKVSILIVFICSCAYGISPNIDFLIMGNDTFYLSLDFNSLPDQSTLNIRNCFTKIPDRCTSSYWKIEENRLYLVGITDCDDKRNRADLKQIFGNQFNRGRVFANWITGELIAEQGQITDYLGRVFYSRETSFKVMEGCLIYSMIYDNSGNYKSVFTQDNPDKLFHFVYSTINWDSIPKLDTAKKVVTLLIVSGGSKRSFEVRIIKGIDPIFNKEALRVTKLIPEWDVLYVHGQPFKSYFLLPIEFSKEARLKYDRRFKKTGSHMLHEEKQTAFVNRATGKGNLRLAEEQNKIPSRTLKGEFLLSPY